ncbi:MAG: penicillin-binding protein 2 [Longimicrobiales bacterium]
MRLDHPLARRSRARGGYLLVAVLMGILILSFFRAQVLRSEDWALRSESNRLRPLPVPAPRGTLFDREGKVLADNVPGYSVVLLSNPIDTMRATLERLAPHLDLAPGEIDALMGRVRRTPRQPLTVKFNADFREVSALEERRGEFTGLYLEMRPRRRYLAGEALAHVLGFLGEVTSAELEEERFSGYEAGMIVGKEGVERQYEGRLQGSQGMRYVEVDALGRIVGSFGGGLETPASPGEDLRLNIDLDLQKWVHGIFPDSMTGAVVALNVDDGGILALYSSPTFDPNDFVGGIGQEAWNALSHNADRPLFNRTVQGVYSPASTWKLATAAIALDLGIVAPDETMPIPCRGGMQFGNRFFRCWKPEGHGNLDLYGAIRHSCNVYFYQLGLRIGLHRMLEEGSRIGFNQRCGIDLPSEARGVFPADSSFWVDTFGYRPTEGEVLHLAIGQGPNSQTPLKMAQFYLAIARDGSAPPPRLFQTEEPPPGGWALDLTPEDLETMREGLRTVMQPGGTAYGSSLEHWDIMGKTGTGQNPHGEDHAWFAGIAGPRGAGPEIVVVVLVEHGQSGSGTAAPLASKAADFYLRKKHGIPVDSVQTLNEHYAHGRPAPWAQHLQTAREGQGGL